MFRERFSFSHQQDLPTRAALFFEHSPTSLLPLISLLSSLWAHSPSDPKTSSFIISSAGACCQMSPTLTHLYHTLFCFVCLSGNQITYISLKPACKHTTATNLQVWLCKDNDSTLVVPSPFRRSPYFITLEPFTFVPLTQLSSCSMCALCVFRMCVFPYLPDSFNPLLPA